MPSRMTLRIWGEAARSRADSSEIVGGGVRLFFPLGIDHRSICSGVDLKTRAEIMGHESARMIRDVYEHVDWTQKV